MYTICKGNGGGPLFLFWCVGGRVAGLWDKEDYLPQHQREWGRVPSFGRAVYKVLYKVAEAAFLRAQTWVQEEEEEEEGAPLKMYILYILFYSIC